MRFNYRPKKIAFKPIPMEFLILGTVTAIQINGRILNLVVQLLDPAVMIIGATHLMATIILLQPVQVQMLLLLV